MQYNCYNVVSVWGAAPPRPPAGESPSSSAPLPSKTSYATALWHTKHQSLILFVLSAFAKRNRNTALYDQQTNFLINLKLYGSVLVYIYLLHHFHISNSPSLVKQNGSWLILNFCSASS